MEDWERITAVSFETGSALAINELLMIIVMTAFRWSEEVIRAIHYSRDRRTHQGPVVY